MFREYRIYWFCLLLAIITEIIGTLSMKWSSVSGGYVGFVIMLIMIALSYIFLSISVKKIALGVAYALWEGIGILFITAFSVIFFEEPLSLLKVAGLATLIIGIVLIKSGSYNESEVDDDLNKIEDTISGDDDSENNEMEVA